MPYRCNCRLAVFNKTKLNNEMKMISLNLFSAVNRRMAIALLVAATAPATINAAPLVKNPFVAAHPIYLGD